MTFSADVFKWALGHPNATIRNVAIDVLELERRKRFPQTCHSAVQKRH